MNGGIGMMDRVTDSIRPKRLMVIVQSNGIIRREPDHYLIGRLAEDVSFSVLDKDIPVRSREDESREPGAHTPGPWHYRDVIRYNGFSCYRFANFSGSFEQWSADENREANAQLISAAPDLLACLKMALVTIEANGLNVPKVQEKIVRVIRQAEGRNSNQCAASRPSCPEIPDKSMPICSIQLADDPRKQMLNEIRTRIYQEFDSCEHHFVHEAMEFILDEMEAKL